MSRFFSKRLSGLTPYTPGEQPADLSKTVKLNTNESPFPPSEAAKRYAAERTRELNLYPDPECRTLRKMIADSLGLSPDEIVVSNGSDEVLYFAFKAFCDDETPIAFPDITYGFYPVFAKINNIAYTEIPLKDDFTIDINDYAEPGRTVVIANPNAPTGESLGLELIERLLQLHPDDIVIIDEAYVDFGGVSAVPLIKKYDNLLVVQTFSKSRSLAGARLGFAAGNAELIRDINTVRNSFNPYNINSMTLAMAEGVLADDEYVRANCRRIEATRAYTESELKKLGFTLTASRANFLFAASDEISGEELYKRLKERGVLVRHFDKERIKNHNRITIGTKEQMDVLLESIREILKEKQG